MARDGRLNRRLLGMLSARLPEARLDLIEDPRDARGKRWELGTVLTAAVIALAAGETSLRGLEELTETLSPIARKRTGLSQRLPDTTARNVLGRLDPRQVGRALRAQVRAAHRRKALEPDGLPFGMASLDGKGTALDGCDDFYAQRQSQGEGEKLVGVLRTVTCSLVSSQAKVVMDAVPIPASTNEMGAFETAFHELVEAYGSLDLFRLVAYDAGACSEHNARLVRERGYHYLFGLKSTQGTLYEEAQRRLAGLPAEQAAASTEDLLGGGRRVLRRLYVTEEMSGWGWQHLRTVLRVESETLDPKGQRIAYDNRYFVSSLPRSRLSHTQWLRVVRLRWAVENECHHTLDAVFREDEKPWIETDPQGALVVALLRRVALNLLALFRSVTQRSSERRATPWRKLLGALRLMLLTLTEHEAIGLRLRALPAPA